MALCSSHRYCTCDVYTTGHKGSGTATKSTTTSCTADGTKCAGYSTTCNPYESGKWAYKCPGHRAHYGNSSISFVNYSTGSVIDHTQIATILSYLKLEITARKKNELYSSISDYNGSVVAKDAVLALQYSGIAASIIALKNKINSIPDHGHTQSTRSSSMNVGTQTYASDLKKLEQDLNEMWTDCICYSDCTSYGLWKKITCTCNGNCGCNYSDERLKNSIIYLYSILLKINDN